MINVVFCISYLLNPILSYWQKNPIKLYLIQIESNYGRTEEIEGRVEGISKFTMWLFLSRYNELIEIIRLCIYNTLQGMTKSNYAYKHKIIRA